MGCCVTKNKVGFAQNFNPTNGDKDINTRVNVRNQQNRLTTTKSDGIINSEYRKNDVVFGFIEDLDREVTDAGNEDFDSEITKHELNEVRIAEAYNDLCGDEEDKEEEEKNAKGHFSNIKGTPELRRGKVQVILTG